MTGLREIVVDDVVAFVKKRKLLCWKRRVRGDFVVVFGREEEDDGNLKMEKKVEKGGAVNLMGAAMVLPVGRCREWRDWSRQEAKRRAALLFSGGSN